MAEQLGTNEDAWVECEWCDGTGERDEDGAIGVCDECHGDGGHWDGEEPA